MDNVIRCNCETRSGKGMIVAVQKADGSVELKHRWGKSIRVEGPGRVYLSCANCGFEKVLVLDRAVQLV